MQLKLSTIPIKNVSEAEAEMNGFLRGHWVLAVKKECVPDGENSFWTFCVGYLGENVAPLRSELLSGTVEVGDYHTFTIQDPKERLICAASFQEPPGDRLGGCTSNAQHRTGAGMLSFVGQRLLTRQLSASFQPSPI